MLETLVNFDQGFFSLINGLNNPFMDTVMWWIADRFAWIPFYLLLIFYLYRTFGKQSLYMVLFAALLITLSDQGSVMIKNLVQRERPCHNELMAYTVHIVNNKCGGQFGFVSSHAANSMALFTYILLLARNNNKKITWITGIYVLLIGYCRVYLGVHYPFDILGGWIVGIVAAIITYVIYRLIFHSPSKYKLK